LRGWEPRQTHRVTEWTTDGHPAAWVTETEPEFDDVEREAWDAWLEWKSSLCPHCGNPRSICSDPMRPWYPQRDVCWATADLEVHERRWRKKHESAKPDEQGRLPTDGTHLWVSPEDLTPDDRFL
jgi:hypothetical protein